MRGGGQICCMQETGYFPFFFDHTGQRFVITPNENIHWGFVPDAASANQMFGYIRASSTSKVDLFKLQNRCSTSLFGDDVGFDLLSVLGAR